MCSLEPERELPIMFFIGLQTQSLKWTHYREVTDIPEELVSFPLARQSARIDASEVSGIIDAPGALPPRNLGIGAQRSGAIRHAVGDMRCDNLLRRLSVLDPLVKGAQRVESIRTGTSATMPHARNQDRKSVV